MTVDEYLKKIDKLSQEKAIVSYIIDMLEDAEEIFYDPAQGASGKVSKGVLSNYVESARAKWSELDGEIEKCLQVKVALE